MRHSVLWACGAVCVFACSPGDPPRSFAVRDSAGVQIVANGPIDGRRAFNLSGPIYSIGWDPEDRPWEAVDLGRLGPGGRATVADRGAREVAMLSAEGDVSAVLGGPGEGPGEIGSLGSLALLGSDTVLVADPGNGRLTLFYKGTVVGTHRFDGVQGGLRIIGGRRSTDLVATSSGYWPYTDEAWIPAVLARYDIWTQEVDTLYQFDWAQGLTEGDAPDPFRAFGWAAVTSEGLLTMRADRPQVERLDVDGRVEMIIRWQEHHLPATDSVWAIYEAVVETRREMWLGDFEKDLARARGAVRGSLPYSSGLLGDDEENIWVPVYAADEVFPPRYRVFGRDGAWRGWVELPAKFRILDVAGGLVLAVQLDEFDVPSVSLHRLMPADAGGK